MASSLPSSMPSSKKSACWNFFKVLAPNQAKCALCGTVLKTTNGSTTSLNRHLRSRHPIPFIAEQKKSKPVDIVNMQDSEMPLIDDDFKDATDDSTEQTTSH